MCNVLMILLICNDIINENINDIIMCNMCV